LMTRSVARHALRGMNSASEWHQRVCVAVYDEGRDVDRLMTDQLSDTYRRVIREV